MHSSRVAEAAFLLTCLEACLAQPLPSMVPHLVFLPRIPFPLTLYLVVTAHHSKRDHLPGEGQECTGHLRVQRLRPLLGPWQELP